MEKEKIIKALECCGQDGIDCCRECPIKERCRKEPNLLERMALSLINELTEENERLKELGSMNRGFGDWYADYLIANGVTVKEWISVEERLPERIGRYLTHCNVEGQSLVCILYYCKVGGFNDSAVTHWMPLPEPPKGGTE